MSQTQNPERTRIYSYMTRSTFLHVEDALEIGKVRLFAGTYSRGQGANQTAHHFVDVEDARVVLADLSWGRAVDFADFKGGGEPPISRVFKVKTKSDKVWLQVDNGPGQRIGQGAVKPNGQPTASVSIPLNAYDARRLALSVLAYLDAWLVAALVAGKPVYAQAPEPAEEAGTAAPHRPAPAPARRQAPAPAQHPAPPPARHPSPPPPAAGPGQGSPPAGGNGDGSELDQFFPRPPASGQRTVPAGDYQGRTLHWLVDHDRAYLERIAEAAQDAGLRQAAAEVLDWSRSAGQAAAMAA